MVPWARMWRVGRLGDAMAYEVDVVYALFVAESLVGRCARFETATALAEEYIDTAGRPPMRIECATPPTQLRVWTYNYVGKAWVE